MTLPPSYLDQLAVLANVALALLLGGAIGFEREEKAKPAGLRTHMLVAGASALFIALSDHLIALGVEQTYGNIIQSDPVRMVEAVATGVSFLGAGTIIRSSEEGRVEGLTTAASILFTAAIGISVAVSQYIIAVGATVMALIILRIINSFEERVLS